MKKDWLKDWWQVIVLIAVSVFCAIFVFGVIVGNNSAKKNIEVVNDTIIQYLPGEVITDTIYYPVAHTEIRHDTAFSYIYRDTSLTQEALHDYTTTRKYMLDYSTDTTGIFKVDLEIEQNKLQKAISEVQPLVKTQTIHTTNTVYKTKPLSFVLTMGTSINLTNYQLSGMAVVADRYVFGATTLLYQNNFGYTINIGMKF